MSIASDEKLKNLEKRVIALETILKQLNDNMLLVSEANFGQRPSPTTISIKDKSWKNAS